MTSSMTLDLTELRNKVSKINVNPRGNLWAQGKKNNTFDRTLVHVFVLLFFVVFLNMYFTVYNDVFCFKGISWGRKVLWIVPI